MKAKHIIAITGVFALLIGVGIISYGFMDAAEVAPSKKVDPDMKKIQIIRSYQGQVNTYDTLVPANSDYTEHDFLAELGFEEDKNLSFIRVADDFLDIDLDFSDFNCISRDDDFQWEGNKFHMKFDLKELEKDLEKLADGFEGMELQLEEMGEKLEKELSEMKIHEKIIINKNGEMHEGDAEQLEEIFEHLGNSFHHQGSMDTTFEKDGAKVRMMWSFSGDSDEMDSLHHNMFNFHHKDLTDEEKQELHEKMFKIHHGDLDIDEENFKMDMDFVMDIDISEEDFVFGPGAHCMKFDFRCDNEEEEDFTLVIVSEGSAEELSKTAEIHEEETAQFRAYPNPAADYVQIVMNFDKKKPTTLSISDLNGKVVEERDFGRFQGEFTQKIDISELAPGAYVIQVQHGNQRLTEKLLVK